MGKILQNRLYLALFFPRLSTDRFTMGRPLNAPAHSSVVFPITVIARNAGGLVIAAVNEAAEKQGIFPGQTLTEARSLCHGFKTHAADTEGDRAILNRLAGDAERFTPLVAMSLPHSLMLDITGCDHLFGGAQKMLKTVISHYQKLGFATQAAIAPTPYAARAQARFAQGGVISWDGLQVCLDPMPLQALEQENAIVMGLRRAGFYTIGAVNGLPRQALTARFGKILPNRLDLLYGKKRHPISPLRPAPVLRAFSSLNEPVMTEDGIKATLIPLAEQFFTLLKPQGVGTRVMEIILFRVDGLRQVLTIETSRPLTDVTLFRGLMDERLTTLAEPLDMGYGYDAFVLAASACERIIASQQSLLDEGNDEVEISGLIDRLSMRLGASRILRSFTAPSYIPECAGGWQAALHQPQPGSYRPADPQMIEVPAFAGYHEAPERPCRIFSPPQPIEVMAGVPDHPPASFRWRRVMHRIRLADGPERISAEWWKKTGPTRDYYRVEDEEGRRFWIFRNGLYSETTQPRWFIHGLFS